MEFLKHFLYDFIFGWRVYNFKQEDEKLFQIVKDITKLLFSSKIEFFNEFEYRSPSRFEYNKIFDNNYDLETLTMVNELYKQFNYKHNRLWLYYTGEYQFRPFLDLDTRNFKIEFEIHFERFFDNCLIFNDKVTNKIFELKNKEKLNYFDKRFDIILKYEDELKEIAKEIQFKDSFVNFINQSYKYITHDVFKIAELNKLEKQLQSQFVFNF